MRYFILVAVFAFVACANADVPKEKNEEHNKIVEECRKKFELTDEEYTNLRHDKLTADPNENMRCFANCFMEKAEIIKDGTLHTDVATKFLSEITNAEKAKGIVETCKGETGKEKCETAYKLHKCFVKNGAY